MFRIKRYDQLTPPPFFSTNKIERFKLPFQWEPTFKEELIIIIHWVNSQQLNQLINKLKTADLDSVQLVLAHTLRSWLSKDSTRSQPS